MTFRVTVGGGFDTNVNLTFSKFLISICESPQWDWYENGIAPHNQIYNSFGRENSKV